MCVGHMTLGKRILICPSLGKFAQLPSCIQSILKLAQLGNKVPESVATCLVSQFSPRSLGEYLSTYGLIIFSAALLLLLRQGARVSEVNKSLARHHCRNHSISATLPNQPLAPNKVFTMAMTRMGCFWVVVAVADLFLNPVGVWRCSKGLGRCVLLWVALESSSSETAIAFMQL